MKKSIISSVFAMAFLFTCFGIMNAAGGQELSSEQESSINKISRAVDKSGAFFKEKNYAKSAGQIREALRLIDRLRSEGDANGLAEKLKKDYDRIAKAQQLLTSKGQSFDPLPAFDELFDSSGEGGSSSKSSAGSDSKNSNGEKVSFVNQVAPILVQHCGQCHIDQSLGRYSLASYDAMRKKSRKGVVVKPKDSGASRLILLVESGQMPKKKPQLPDEQIQILKDWINQGAKFDGKSRAKKESLKSFVSHTEGSGSKGSDSKGSDSKGSDSKGSDSKGNVSKRSGSRGSGSKGSGRR